MGCSAPSQRPLQHWQPLQHTASGICGWKHVWWALRTSSCPLLLNDTSLVVQIGEKCRAPSGWKPIYRINGRYHCYRLLHSFPHYRPSAVLPKQCWCHHLQVFQVSFFLRQWFHERRINNSPSISYKQQSFLSLTPLVNSKFPSIILQRAYLG